MADVKLVACQGCWYDGRARPSGEVFVATAEHAKVLKLIGHAKDAPSSLPEATVQPLSATYAHKDETADDETAAVKSKRAYKRRDLTAEP